ncbi:MAG: HEPN domain-containing protein [ANME-2 cluster archaeon]|nr:HEPN domain-containing protein [ANME-2 cluster archaeon]MBC2745564.1 HEPN domain-containing protein [ANME-2 cluster archaeon]
MSEKESSLPEDWFEKGDEDKKAVEILLKHGGSVSVSSYLIQQMLEKYIKGFLPSKNWRLKRTHDLEELLDKMVEYDLSFEEFRELSQEATAFYFFERYPFFGSELSREEVERIYNKSLELIWKIEEDKFDSAEPRFASAGAGPGQD